MQSLPVTVDKVGRKVTVVVTKGHYLWSQVSTAVRKVAAGGKGAFNEAQGRYEFGMAELDEILRDLTPFGLDVGDALATWQLQQAEAKQLEYAIPDAPEPWAKHQLEGILHALRNTCSIILDDQGLGKTRQAGAAIYERINMGAIKVCLVICPNSVKTSWLKEMAHCFPDLRCAIFKKSMSKKGIPATVQVLIVNYEMVRYAHTMFVDWVGDDMAVLDEGHRIKSRPVLGVENGKRVVVKGKTAWAINQLQPRFRMVLSGTLVANRPEDVWFPINWAMNGFFPDYFTWLKQIAKVGNAYSKTAIAEYKLAGLAMLREQMGRVSLRRLKSEVLDLPERTYQIRYVGMTNEQRVMYENARMGMLGDYLQAYAPGAAMSLDELQSQGTSENPLARMNALEKTLRMAQIAANPRLVGPEYPEVTLKYQEAIDLIEDCSGPVIVWTCYKYDQARMYQMLADVGIGATIINGDVPVNLRSWYVDTWRRGEVKVLLATPASYSEGVTLNEADTMIYINRSWSHLHRSQSQDRNYRMGQTKSVTVYDIVVAGTVDELILEALQRKADMMAYLQTETTSDPAIDQLIAEYLAKPATKE